MAIPFHIPTDEETEDVYRRLDQLLLDLYDLLRQILLRRSIYREPRVTEEIPIVHHHEEETPQPAEPPREEQPRVSSLPDVVAESMPLVRKPPVPPPRRHRRRLPKTQQHQLSNQTRFAQHHPNPPSSLPSLQSYINVGIELRQIAEEFTYNSVTREGVTKKRREIKASSLFSLLVPAPIAGSIWTTVIILVGWRILSKQR